MQLVHQFNSSIDGDNVIIESEMWSPFDAGHQLLSGVKQNGLPRKHLEKLISRNTLLPPFGRQWSFGRFCDTFPQVRPFSKIVVHFLKPLPASEEENIRPS